MKKVIDFFWDNGVGKGYFFLEDSDVHVWESGAFLQSCRDGRFGEHTEARKLADGRIIDVLGFHHPDRKKITYAEHVITTIQTMLDKGYGLSFKAQKQFDYWKNRFAGEELEKERHRQEEEKRKAERKAREEAKKLEEEKQRQEAWEKHKLEKGKSWWFAVDRYGKLYVWENGYAYRAQKEDLELYDPCGEILIHI